jgi:bacillithiol biosynthesis deacetylase BshB1
MKLDVLAFGAHPDDVELSCAGTLYNCYLQGKKTGIVDLTRGELGTRGTAEKRDMEAKKAAEILKLSVRENLCLADGFFQYNHDSLNRVIEMIRKYQPEIVFCNAIRDRHPDHGRGSHLVSDACFYAGLIKIKTMIDGEEQKAWRPRAVYHYIQDRYIEPTFLVDISASFDKKIESIKAFSSQFFDPNSTEPETPISSKQFFETIKDRAHTLGRIIHADYAEGFTCERYPGVKDVFQLI